MSELTLFFIRCEDECGFERVLPVSEEELDECPECGAELDLVEFDLVAELERFVADTEQATRTLLMLAECKPALRPQVEGALAAIAELERAR